MHETTFYKECPKCRCTCMLCSAQTKLHRTRIFIFALVSYVLSQAFWPMPLWISTIRMVENLCEENYDKENTKSNHDVENNNPIPERRETWKKNNKFEEFIFGYVNAFYWIYSRWSEKQTEHEWISNDYCRSFLMHVRAFLTTNKINTNYYCYRLRTLTLFKHERRKINGKSIRNSYKYEYINWLLEFLIKLNY